MSTIDTAKERGAHETRAAAAAALPRVETPIVPQSTIAGRALVAVVAIMTFLASLTTGAVMLVRAAAIDWQADVAREVTIQVRPVAGRDIEADIAQAVAIARAFPGVAEVRPYSKEEAGRLLEPWLGTGLQLDDLPMPRKSSWCGLRPARRPILRNCAMRLPRKCRVPAWTTIAASSSACAPWRAPPCSAASPCSCW